MSDYNSSLPVRTESAGDLAVKIVDSTVTSQQLTVNPDGSINTTVSATNLDIRDLSAATDNVAISDGTDTLAVNADGSINSVISDGGGSITVDASNLDIRDLAFATDKVDVSGSSVTVSATDLDIRDLAFATDKVDVTGSDVTATVTATNLDIRDLTHVSDSVKVGDGTDFLAINADGSVNVVVTSSVVGTPVLDFQQSSAVAGGATANNDYTVTSGTQLKLNSIFASASGKMKIEVQVETGVATNTFTTKFVGFNSTANPNIEIFPAGGLMVAAGVRVRIAMTNKENQAQDLYSTIEGSEI
jgi:hypothetical protein